METLIPEDFSSYVLFILKKKKKKEKLHWGNIKGSEQLSKRK